jgi:polyisoprenoid-binding protein YceI
MMVSKVRGQFKVFNGVITTGVNVENSEVVASVDATSIDTNNEQRDGHVKSADFFAVEQYPTWQFRSTAVRPDALEGELTIKGVTRPVTFDLEFTGFGPDAYGGTRAGFEATTVINRNDFGVDIAMPLETGGVVVGDKVTVTLDIEGVLRTA